MSEIIKVGKEDLSQLADIDFESEHQGDKERKVS